MLQGIEGQSGVRKHKPQVLIRLWYYGMPSTNVLIFVVIDYKKHALLKYFRSLQGFSLTAFFLLHFQMQLAVEEKCEFLPFLSPKKVFINSHS